MSTNPGNAWRKWNGLRAILAAGLMAVAGAAANSSLHAATFDPPKAEAAADDLLDEVLFRDGTKVTGKILEETEVSIKMTVIVGKLKAEASYEKSRILEIRRGVVKPADGGSTPARTEEPKNNTPAEAADPNAVKVYAITMKGEFGRDVSHTPMERVVEDMKKHQPDVMVLVFDNTFSQHEEEMPDFMPDGSSMYDMLETARQIETLLTDRIRDDSGFTKKPRLVGWIRKAMGGAAFMPFVCPELYYHPDAYHGGIGYLDHMFDGVGDERAREKQYSLRLARAVGLAEKGGYDGRIMKAMSRTDFVLSYRLVGGRPEFLERLPTGPDEFLLTDDGLNERADLMPDIIRFKGNDVLTLDAVTAMRIGMSRGTVTSLDELMFEIGIPRNHTLIDGQQEEILKKWGEEVTRAENDIRRLLREYQQVQVREPGGYNERTAARGKRKQLLLQIKGILERYGEAINPRKVGSPEGLLQQIDLVIYQIEQEQRLDRRT